MNMRPKRKPGRNEPAESRAAARQKSIRAISGMMEYIIIEAQQLGLSRFASHMQAATRVLEKDDSETRQLH